MFNVYYEYDLNGFAFWKTPYSVQSLYLESSTTPQIIPQDNDGYKFWFLDNGSSGSRAFHYESGGEWYYRNTFTIVNTITLSDKTLYLRKTGGALHTPINKVGLYFATPVPYPNEIYFLIYTDEDLSYITDSVSLYNYLDNLANYNSIYGGTLPEQGLTLPAGTCDDLGTFAGAMCRVLTYLFIPSTDSLDSFTDLKDEISDKPPLGYFFSIKDALGDLSATSTPAFVYPDVGILESGVFSLLRNAILIVMWIFFGFWVIRRIGNFDF